MEGTPDPPSVEGPVFAQRIKEANQVIDRLEAANWDFDLVPEVYARKSRADVLAKELVFLHDGKTQTIFGRLVTGGVGARFNLMGPIQANAMFRIAPTDIFDVLHKQTKTRGVADLKEFRALPKAEPVELFNYTNFYSLRDLVFWHVLYRAGSYPSTLAHMARNFPLGKVIQNSMYRPEKPSRSAKKPSVMTFGGLTVTFATPRVEWMEQPLYGGLVQYTMQAEYLLTPRKSDVSHPYLPLASEGQVSWAGRKWYVRYFLGTTPKDALNGPGMGPEGAKPVRRR